MKSNWKADLKKVEPAGSPPDADCFWTEFRQRAETCEQESPSRAHLRPQTLRGWAYAAALLAIAAWGALHFLPAPRAVAGSPLIAVKSLDIRTSYDSVCVIDDPDNRGTLLWISGLPEAKKDSSSPGDDHHA